MVKLLSLKLIFCISPVFLIYFMSFVFLRFLFCRQQRRAGRDRVPQQEPDAQEGRPGHQ